MDPETAKSWIEAGPTALLLGAAVVEALVIRVFWSRMNDLEKRNLEMIEKYAEASRKREIASESVLHRVSEAINALTDALAEKSSGSSTESSNSRRSRRRDELTRNLRSTDGTSS